MIQIGTAPGMAFAETGAAIAMRRWSKLCERFLPVEHEESLWRFSRCVTEADPMQGWKLHVSATLPEACDVFESVAPYLTSKGILFKAPKSLDVLSKINCGLQYGYCQVGKFITVYTHSDAHAVDLAAVLDGLTKDFVPITVPYDNRYTPGSSVFYRYGAFTKAKISDGDDKTVNLLRDSDGRLVPDDRLKPVPRWVSDPFADRDKSRSPTFENTPLGTDYLIFRAIAQRGKGGTYEAFDLTLPTARISIVKEGRRHGERGWDGNDGYRLAQNEFSVLSELQEKEIGVPRPLASFELNDNFYFAMEFVDGLSLRQQMDTRVRRFSIRRVLELSIRIARILERIHQAGWVWNDCKPGNLIVTRDGELRPIDFETASPVGVIPNGWRTIGFSKPEDSKTTGVASDLYSLGAIIYFLLTGCLYDSEEPIPIRKRRRGVPHCLTALTDELVAERHQDSGVVADTLKKIAAQFKGLRTA
jgi:Protein kinase domain